MNVFSNDLIREDLDKNSTFDANRFETISFHQIVFPNIRETSYFKQLSCFSHGTHEVTHVLYTTQSSANIAHKLQDRTINPARTYKIRD